MKKKLPLLAVCSMVLFFAAAQNVGIGTTTPVARLHVADSNVLFTGAAVFINPGNPPVSGAGTRMMWYANKAAFRVGAVSGNNWNKDSIGYFSFASGEDSKAKGYASTAMGASAATGEYSFSAGGNSLAKGDYSLSIGFIDTAAALSSIAIGNGSKALGQNSIAFGNNTLAKEDLSLAMGNNAEARDLASYSIGEGTIAKATGGFTIGIYNDTTDAPIPSTPNLTDRLFQIGNGDYDNRNNSITILRNGNTGIGVLNPLEKLDVAGKTKTTSFQVTSGAASGSVLISDAAGNAVWQTLPSTNSGLEASTFASQSIPNNVLTKVIFDSEFTDDAVAFNTVTSELTIPSTGFYHLNSAISFSTVLPANTFVVLYLYNNGSLIKIKRSTNTGQPTIDISADIKLTANDIITVYVSQASGAPAIVENGREGTYFSAFKVY
jgi:Head domain of trimeric autotransporter adhesin